MNIQKVMLVDDDTNIRIIAEITLADIGNWQVVLADSGTSAIETAKRERPDLILLDVMMPGMDGPTTLEKLQECLDPMPPVIFLTAKVQSTEVEHYQSLGAAGVIRKPFDPVTLPDEIRALLDGTSVVPEWQESSVC